MSSKKPAKSSNSDKKVANTITQETVIKVLKTFDVDIKPSKLLKTATELWNEFERATGPKQKEIADKLNKKLEHASAIYALDNHFLLAETLDKEKYRTLMIELANQLIAEYDCKTTTEKMLAQTTSWAYCRMIEYSYKLNSLTRQDFISNEKNGYYSMLSKEVDRCTRQYLTAISTLKHFKQPSLSVTFKANNAFVAQNQQINSDGKQPPREKTNAGQ